MYEVTRYVALMLRHTCGSVGGMIAASVHVYRGEGTRSDPTPQKSEQGARGASWLFGRMRSLASVIFHLNT